MRKNRGGAAGREAGAEKPMRPRSSLFLSLYLDRLVQVGRARKVNKAKAAGPVGGPVLHDGGVGGVEGREFWGGRVGAGGDSEGR